MPIPTYLPLSLLAAVVMAAPLTAQRRPADVPPARARVAAHAKVRHEFRVADRGLFRNYYRTHHLVVTPLRPELARLIVRGKPLPEGVVQVALAAELLAQVPPPEPGYRYAIVGDRIVMLDDNGLVDDILDDIFP
ncbi:MAG: hypothetical protein ABJC19_11920 [Gemmatimonadota bacterium]